MDTPQRYERAYDLVERPFSLTPDEKYHFRSASQARALEIVGPALRRGERFLMVTGDLGAGKTIFCRTLARHLARLGPVAFAANPLLRPEDLLRLLLQDFCAVTPDEVRRGRLAGATRADLEHLLNEFLRGQEPVRPAVVIIDEAQLMPQAIVEQLIQLSRLEDEGAPLIQFVLVSQSAGSLQSITEQRLDAHVGARARLTALERHECREYIAHRLGIAGCTAKEVFSARAIDAIYDLSGGVPRLINLLCERALQEGASSGARRLEPATIESAATALEFLRTRPRRFRWFRSRASSW